MRALTKVMGLVGALLLTLPATAQTLRPKVRSIVPTGGQRGTSVECVIAGVNIGYGTALLFENPGITVATLKPETPAAGAKNPESKLTATLALAPGLPPGRYVFRVATPLGSSEPGYVVVGQWPELTEKEPNNTPQTAQALMGPVTVNAKSDGGEDVDVYKVTLTAGEPFVAEAQAGSSLGAAATMEPVLVLRDTDGHDVASASALARPDARLIFTPRKSGEYFLVVRDLRYQGSADHHYRLSIGKLPTITSTFPLGGQAGSTARLALTGVNLLTTETTFALPSELPFDPMPFTQGLRLDVSPFPDTVEAEPNDSVKLSQLIALPVTVNGQLTSPSPTRPDVDCFRFAATKGQVVLLEVFAARLGSRLDGVLTVLNKDGGELASNDDARGKDPFLAFTAPDNGEFTVRISDLNGRSGPEFSYRLRVAPATPEFALTVAPDCLSIAPGDRIPVIVSATRQYGLDSEIALSFTGLPPGVQLVGTPQIPRGQSEVTLFLTADASAAPSPTVPLRVTGSAQNLTRLARALQEEYVKEGDVLKRTTRPVPLPLTSVTGPADVTVALASERVELKAGQTVELIVKLTRKPGFEAKVPLILTGLPTGVTVTNPEVPEKQSEHKLIFKAEANAAIGEVRLTLTARSVVDELRFTPHVAPPITLNVSK
nr:PPC domain-containing protein [Armatimonas sp.]